MKLFDAFETIHNRKAAALGFEDDTDAGKQLPLDQWRPVLLGLDLDIREVDWYAQNAAKYVSEHLGTDPSPEAVFSAIRTIGGEFFITGVYFERERRRRDDEVDGA